MTVTFKAVPAVTELVEALTVKWVAAAALTAMVLVPVIVVVAVSVAVTVCVPAVLSVTLKEPVPLVNVLLAGKLAARRCW